ncbi:hypothetical protein D7147_02800 [Micromonospora musae]|uniref:DUF998 domain-containing protein n=1 Tax=Micromonospora musae TaxID=1894970 RepID=A0A3A9Y355_9ACTN|nr:hypothetical protein [Micromonospora musae]RKN24296.1 hypothetical protein D7147_02800 [Micromonospora musae]RKN31901.1 hypothetical protein D7044_15605 [Micromonospora musae]
MPAERHPDRLPLRRRLVPAVALLLLAPWAAECSWGGFTLTDTPFVILVLAPMYGGAALLIRETARRVGAGWPTIALFAAAFGVIQAGLVDQSLFNPGFLDDTEFADTQATAEATLVPGLDFSARQAFDYIGNHIALSICAPIVIVESLLRGDRRSRPWLGRPGLTVVTLLYLAGSLLIFSDDEGRKDFLASPAQVGFAVTVAVALIGAGLLIRRRRGSPALPAPPVVATVPATAGAPVPAHDSGVPAAPAPHDDSRPPVAAKGRRAPRPVWPGLVVLVAYAGSNLAPGWAGIAVGLVLAAAAATLLVTWSRRSGWGQRQVLAAGTASMLVAAAYAYAVPTYAPATPAAALVGDIAISIVTLTLIGGAAWRLRMTSSTVHAAAS